MKHFVAVLLTCHNRKWKTLSCLNSFYQAYKPDKYQFDIFLVDDRSKDGTGSAVRKKFPQVNIIQGNGDLYWAGGMRLAWKKALSKKKKYDAFLLLNDDVILKDSFLALLVLTHKYSKEKTGMSGIYSAATIDLENGDLTYSGSKIRKSGFYLRIEKAYPDDIPKPIDMANGNILWVSSEVVDRIGQLDKIFTHGIADYDYTLRAKKKGFPIWLAPGVGGYCNNEHGDNWKSKDTTLKERIEYLRSPTGLAYKEYLLYIWRHFPMFLPYSFVMLWLKTLFPFIWEFGKRD